MSPNPPPNNPSRLKLWQKLATKKLGDYRIFTVRADQAISPRTGKQHEVYVIDCVNWVNVVATTADGHMVMVEQYRHGSNTIELEIPGGMMDLEDASPIATALRELKEETGFEGANENAQVIGTVYPNPAIMSNSQYTILVENCVEKHETTFDSGEDLITRLVPIADIPGLVRQGKIRHSLVLVALYHFELWAQAKARPGKI